MEKENNNSIKMGYINPKRKKFKKKLNLKVIGTSVVAIGAAAIVAVSSSAMGQWFKGFFGKKEVNIPNDKTSIVFSIELERGDTVSEIADKFYNSDTKDVYGSFSNYTDEIEQANRRGMETMEAGEILKVPVIVDKDNPYYIEIVNIQKQIEELKKNNYWIKYKVQYGDRISSLALLASGSDKEIHDLVNEICSKNNISSKTVINEGEEIWIINPELGNLKQQLNDAMEQLKQSLIEKQSKK